MTKLEVNSLFEEEDLKNKGYKDILDELVEDFISKNKEGLEKMNTLELIGSISLTYKNNSYGKSQNENNNERK